MLNYENLDLFYQSNDIIIIGECHGYPEYQDLIQSVLEEYNPDGVAVESATTIKSICGGLPISKEYSKNRDIPLALVDQSDSWMSRNLGENWLNIVYEANKYQEDVIRLGDINPSIVRDARNIIRDKFGQREYNILYTIREQHMASRVKKFQESIDGVVILVCGAFHVYALSKFIDIVPGYIQDERIIEDEFSYSQE